MYKPIFGSKYFKRYHQKKKFLKDPSIKYVGQLNIPNMQHISIIKKVQVKYLKEKLNLEYW